MLNINLGLLLPTLSHKPSDLFYKNLTTSSELDWLLGALSHETLFQFEVAKYAVLISKSVAFEASCRTVRVTFWSPGCGWHWRVLKWSPVGAFILTNPCEVDIDVGTLLLVSAHNFNVLKRCCCKY